VRWWASIVPTLKRALLAIEEKGRKEANASEMVKIGNGRNSRWGLSHLHPCYFQIIGVIMLFLGIFGVFLGL